MEEFIEDIERELPPVQSKEVHTVLSKIMRNIMRNPCEPKFRTLRKDNKLVAESVCLSMAAVSLLLLVGFEDQDERYHCPMATDLEQMRAASEALDLRTMDLDALAAASAPATLPVPQRSAPSQDLGPRQVPVDLLTGEPLRAKPELRADLLTGEPQMHPAEFQGSYTEPDAISGDAHHKSPSRSAMGKQQPASKSLYAFQRRAAGQELQKQDVADIRRLRQDRFEEFQKDPHARTSEAYMQPASGLCNPESGNSVSPGKEKSEEGLDSPSKEKPEQGLGEWFSGTAAHISARLSNTSEQFSRSLSKSSAQLSCGLATTSEQLSQSLSKTFPQVSAGLSDTSEQLSQGFSRTSQQLSSSLSRTVSQAGGWLGSPTGQGPGTGETGGGAPPPGRFEVVAAKGAMVRRDVDLESMSVGVLPQGTEFVGLELRCIADSGEKLPRLRLEEPLRGWITCKPTIVSRVSADEQESVVGLAPVGRDMRLI